MSALSVLSPIVPTAPGGTASASAEAAASDGLFAGMVAAVAPSTKASGDDSEALLDLPSAESDAVETPALDTAVAAPAWPPIPLIAPAPPPVAPSIASDAPDASAAGATPPPSSAPLPNSPAMDTAPVAPAAAAPSLPNTPVAPGAPLAAEAAEPIPAAEPPATETTTPAQGGKAAEPDAPRAPEPSTLPSSVQAKTELTAAASASEALASPRSNAVETAPRQAEPSTRPIASASDDVVATKAASASTNIEADDPRLQPAAQTRSAAPASPQIAATTAHNTSPAVGTASQAQAQAEPLKAPTNAPRVEAAPLPERDAPAIIAPTRPQTMASAQPLAAPSAEVADTPEQAASALAASIPSDAESEAAQPKAQPAPPTAPPTTALPVTPARNGTARLDDRPSNAASSTAQTDAKTDAKGDALGTPRLAQSAASAQATTPSVPVLSDNLAAKPAAPVEAAPLDASAAPDLAPSQQVLDAQNAAPAASRDLGLSQLSRATIETTAQIAAQILKKLDGRSTRFDMALTPDDLGRVDVSMEIDSDGRLTARLAFDNPAAATELRGRADELRRQLQDAGFQLTQDSLEFSERNPSSGFGGGAFDRAPDRRAFAGAARVAANADTVLPPPLSGGLGAWTSLSQTRDRVDLKV